MKSYDSTTGINTNSTLRVLLACAVILVTLTAADGCEREASSEQEQNRKQADMLAESNRQVGMPGITNYTEKRFAKHVQELRDQEITTYTYTIDRDGDWHFVCESVGYGIPYSVQFTNPEKIERSRHNYGYAITPQADPNGLYMPENVDATWILCSDGDDGVRPVYSEPQIMVTPYPREQGPQ